MCYNYYIEGEGRRIMPNEIILFSTGCPLCKGLEKALKYKNIEYILCNDINTMKELGIKQVPQLMVDDQLMKNPQALKWVLSQE